MNKRILNKTVDPSSISNLTYNEAAGAQKNTEVGAHLKPLQIDGTTFSTDATTARRLPGAGKNLAIYNNAAAVGSVTLGDVSIMAALAVGATDASGNVGIPCKPNDWTFIACNEKQYVRTNAVTLLVFIIEDDTSIKNQ